ncbi:unnamed protein product [Bemisia tabaci]|uniref:Uncharacterized protein n=1 Tax=Bemisia tabaci TaxID=7038 RepID=A0A9P0AJK3_BEMTA|nr:PREDICTED: uncharacterized protein LOC109038135 [Bemisia tabaci]CAH0393206.1 unnamed protein product [Bemisia tabaci]
MAYLKQSLSLVLLLAAACVAQQQQSAQQSSQVKLEDIEQESNQRPQAQSAQGSPSPAQVPQLSPQQIAAFQQQYLVQPQQYFAPQFTFPEFQGVPLHYVPAGAAGANQPNVPPFQAYYVPQAQYPQAQYPQHVVPVVPQGQEAFRGPFTQHFIQHPAPQQAAQGAPQGVPQGQRTVSVIPPNNAVYRTIQPPFGANLIYTNPPALPPQIIFTQPQPQANYAVNAFQQRPSKAQYSSGVKSTPATPTKSPDYSNYAQTSSAAASSSAASTSANDQQYRFSG